MCVLSDDETWVGFSSGLFPTDRKKLKEPAVFMTSAEHTAILIATSLLQGEKIGYLRASTPPFLPPYVSSHRPLFCRISFFFLPALLHTLLNFILSSSPLPVSLLRSSGFCFVCASSCPVPTLHGGIFVTDLLSALKRTQAEDERSSRWEDAQFLNCSQVEVKNKGPDKQNDKAVLLTPVAPDDRHLQKGGEEVR